jgi:hypothetical protein
MKGQPNPLWFTGYTSVLKPVAGFTDSSYDTGDSYVYMYSLIDLDPAAASNQDHAS